MSFSGNATLMTLPKRVLLVSLILSFTIFLWASQSFAQQPAVGNVPANPPHSTQNNAQGINPNDTFTFDEVLNTGHKFFGSVSGGLASVVERAFSRFGLPNGYILGEQAAGAFVGGLQYGEGVLYTKNAGQYKTFWQGPTIGWDFGGAGTRTMMLVYQLPNVDALYKRFPGVSGSAVVIGGIEMSVRKRGPIVIVPIRSGVGARLGVNVGYLKFTTKPTFNPF